MEWSLEDIDFRSIGEDLLRNIWVILLAVLTAFFGISGIFRLTYVPEYTASATLAVNITGAGSNGLTSLEKSQEMAEVFGEVFQSDTLRNKIAQTMETEELDAKISIELVEETNLIILNVSSGTPKTAYLTIQAALKDYKEISDYLYSNARLDILQPPVMPYGTSNPLKIAKYEVLGMLAAAVLVIGLIAVLSFMRPTVKKSDRAKKQLDGKILGVIPMVQKYQSRKEMWLHRLNLSKENTSVLITSRMLGKAFTESYRRTSTMLERHMERRQEKILLITGVGENEGKSSMAANLALALSEKKNKVLLIDFDWRKPSLHKIFDQAPCPGKSVSDSIEGNKNWRGSLKQTKTGLHILYQYAPIPNLSAYLSSEKLRTLFEELRQEYDFILIDTPPMAVSADAEVLMQYADASMLCVRRDHMEIGSINDSAEILRRTGKDFIGFVLNRFYAASAVPPSHANYGYSGGQLAEHKR